MKNVKVVGYILVMSLFLGCKLNNNHYYINTSQETIIPLCENDLYSVNQLQNKSVSTKDILEFKKIIKEIKQRYSISTKIQKKEYEIDIENIDVKIIEKTVDVSDLLINVRGIILIGNEKIIYGSNPDFLIRINDFYYQLSKEDYDDLMFLIEKSKSVWE